ncbi:MAG: hypothetical protein K8R40_07195 [Anaerolineaceae bacterium]|nr:hypothetical protein [Anaerolineaceae bacterium]
MSTFIMIYGLVILLGVCLVGSGVVLLVKNFPDKIKDAANFRKSTPGKQSPIKRTNEQIQEILRDFEEKWRNPQK